MKLVKSPALAALCLIATLGVAQAGPPVGGSARDLAPQEEPPKTDAKPTDEKPAEAPAPTGDPVDLKLKFTAGDKHAYEVSTSIDQNMDMGGMQMSTQIRMNQAWNVEVISLREDGSADVKLNYGRISGSMENPMMGVLEFDSETAAADSGNPMLDLVGKAFTAMANQSLEARLDQRGKMTEVKGVEKILESLGDSLAMMGQLKDQLSADGITQQFEQAFVALPEGGVRVNESWEDASEAAGAMGSKVKVKKLSRLSEVTDEVAKIAVEGSMELDFSGGDDEDVSSDPQMAMMRELLKEAKISANSFKGTTSVSRKNGFPVSNTNELRMTMEMPNPQGGAAMVIEQIVKTSLKKVE